MKKLMMVAFLTLISVTAKALSYEMARNEALFLSDKMAYELNLTASQYEAVYEINFDYFLCVGSSIDVYNDLWKQRNFELQMVLTPYQYETYLRTKYFYRPLGWRDGRWEFRIYRHYQNRGHFLMARPRAFSSYRGGRHFSPQGTPGRVVPRGGNVPPRTAPRPNGARPPQQGQRPQQAQPQQRPPQQQARPQQGQRQQPQTQRPQRTQQQQGQRLQQRSQQQGQRTRR